MFHIIGAFYAREEAERGVPYVIDGQQINYEEALDFFCWFCPGPVFDNHNRIGQDYKEEVCQRKSQILRWNRYKEINLQSKINMMQQKQACRQRLEVSLHALLLDGLELLLGRLPLRFLLHREYIQIIVDSLRLVFDLRLPFDSTVVSMIEAYLLAVL